MTGLTVVLAGVLLGGAVALAGDAAQEGAALMRDGKYAEAGFRGLDTARNDPDLEALRSRPDFPSVLESIDRNARPCEFDARHRALDFWIGDWIVETPEGVEVGRNRIEKAQNGCALIEHWTSRGGGHGISVNYVDPETGRWKQNWVNDSGGIVRYEGEVVDGVMRFRGENVDRDGSREAARAELRPLGDGRVRHTIETSDDGGKTWVKSFEAIYRPVESGS